MFDTAFMFSDILAVVYVCLRCYSFNENQNCRCEPTKTKMLGTQQLRVQLAVRESVWQSVLLHRNLKIGFEAKLCV